MLLHSEARAVLQYWGLLIDLDLLREEAFVFVVITHHSSSFLWIILSKYLVSLTAFIN